MDRVGSCDGTDSNNSSENGTTTHAEWARRWHRQLAAPWTLLGRPCPPDNRGHWDGAAFGYLNLPDAPPDRLRTEARALRAAAWARNWPLAGIHRETVPGDASAFDRMRAELGRLRGPRRVLVPSTAHFGRDRFTRFLRLSTLEIDRWVDVIALDRQSPHDLVFDARTATVADDPADSYDPGRFLWLPTDPVLGFPARPRPRDRRT